MNARIFVAIILGSFMISLISTYFLAIGIMWAWAVVLLIGSFALFILIRYLGDLN